MLMPTAFPADSAYRRSAARPCQSAPPLPGQWRAAGEHCPYIYFTQRSKACRPRHPAKSQLGMLGSRRGASLCQESWSPTGCRNAGRFRAHPTRCVLVRAALASPPCRIRFEGVLGALLGQRRLQLSRSQWRPALGDSDVGFLFGQAVAQHRHVHRIFRARGV